MTKKQATNPQSNEVAANTDNGRGKNLYVSVDTFDNQNPPSQLGTRIVDMYHFGTLNWLQNHHWWAMHNGHTVVVEIADEEAVEAHIVAAKEALAAKYNVASVAAA